MTKLADTILKNQAYTRGRNVPMSNLALGGQFGFQPDYPAYMSNTPYTRRPLIAKLIEAPLGFKDMPEPDLWFAALKNLIEVEPKTIDGLQMGLTVDTSSVPFGGAGEQFDMPTNVTRAVSNPSFGYTERFGRSIWAFYNAWITEMIMDPNSKYHSAITRSNNPKTPWLPDYYGMTVLFFEPDATHSKIDKAWLCGNMFPKSDGAVEGRRDLTGGGETIDLSIEFSALSQVGIGVNLFAQRFLDEMNLTGNNPLQRPAFIDAQAASGKGGVAADVAKGANGYSQRIAAAARNAVTGV